MQQGAGLMTFELDREGGAEVLKEIAADTINEIALRVAESADAIGEPAQVADYAQVAEYTTDRAAASVTVTAERQAKYGVLTKAAAAAGLEVKPR